MKTNGLDLELQAYADGQLDQLEGLTPARRAELDRQFAGDAAVRAQVEGLRSLSRLLRENEPVHAVPASREFYWSQIQRRITAAEQAEARALPTVRPASPWLRWWLPIVGTAAVGALAVLVSIGGLGNRPLGESAALENGSAESGAVVFRSEAEGVTICWLD